MVYKSISVSAIPTKIALLSTVVNTNTVRPNYVN